MEKSAEAFRTISEVAELLDTPAHVLRFWESRFPQIKPVKRAGGRRYYRPSDIALLTGIKRLLHDQGLTIRGVQRVLREQGIRYVSDLPVAANGHLRRAPVDLARDDGTELAEDADADADEADETAAPAGMPADLDDAVDNDRHDVPAAASPQNVASHSQDAAPSPRPIRPHLPAAEPPADAPPAEAPAADDAPAVPLPLWSAAGLDAGDAIGADVPAPALPGAGRPMPAAALGRVPVGNAAVDAGRDPDDPTPGTGGASPSVPDIDAGSPDGPEPERWLPAALRALPPGLADADRQALRRIEERLRRLCDRLAAATGQP